MAFNTPAVSDFKLQFIRDFPYGTDPNVSVLDADIQNALTAAFYGINPALWDDQTSYTYGYLLLTAHNLVLSLRASSQGLNGQYNFAQASKVAGPISEGFSIPERIQNNPAFMMLAKTNYGASYLEILLPKLCGQSFYVHARTKP